MAAVPARGTGAAVTARSLRKGGTKMIMVSGVEYVINVDGVHVYGVNGAPRRATIVEQYAAFAAKAYWHEAFGYACASQDPDGVRGTRTATHFANACAASAFRYHVGDHGTGAVLMDVASAYAQRRGQAVTRVLAHIGDGRRSTRGSQLPRSSA